MAAVAVWIAIWQIAAVIVSNGLILTGPWQVLTALFKLLSEASFWKAVWGSFYRIALGFLIASIAGIALAVLSHKVKYVNEFLAPPMSVFKTVPVASFIVLMLISLNTKENLSLLICFIMVLPIVYANTLSGLNSIDKNLLEMAKVFRVKKNKKLFYIYFHKTLPFFETGTKISLGLCWKSGVAAELIGLVQGTIGNELYYAKLYLLMDNVFAWTVVIVLLSAGFEALILCLLKLLKRRIEK